MTKLVLHGLYAGCTGAKGILRVATAFTGELPHQLGPRCLAIAGDEGSMFPARIIGARASLLGGSWELRQNWCAPISIQGYETRYVKEVSWPKNR